MIQDQKKSIREALIQTLIGTASGFLLTYIIFPLFSVYTSVGVIGGITFVFLFISLTKNYIIRRIFNWSHHSSKWMNFLHGEQKDYQSLFESASQTIIGTVISFWASVLIYPWFGLDIPKLTIGYITLVFMVISVIKNYIIRRFFEKGKM